MIRALIRILPGPVRDEIVRRSIRLPKVLPENLVFKIAETTDELESAFRLVYENYLPLGYCQENSHSLRATVFHALPSTTTLLALDKNRLVGTLTIVRDNRIGLPLDEVFDVDSLRKNSHRLAEITSLVIDKEYRREKGGEILFPLLRLMYEYSTSYFGVNHLLVTIHPKDAYFYKSLLMFKTVPGTGVRMHLGAPAVSLHLDLQNALLVYNKTYGSRDPQTNLFDFFVKRKMPNVQLPRREYNKINDPVVSPSYFKTLFLERLNLGTGHRDRRGIEACLQRADLRRENPRIEVEAPAQILRQSQSGIPERMTLKDVSRNGFRASVRENFTLQTDYDLKIEVAAGVIAQVRAQALWMSPSRGVGFRISEADPNWHQFVTFLYREQFEKVN